MTSGHFYDRSLTGVYDAVGGIEAFRRISQRFHHKVEDDPLLRGLFPKNMGALEERLALYLTERTGGFPDYTVARGKTSLFCRHAHLAIGPAEAERWLALMRESLREEGVSQPVATRLLANLTALAATLADPFLPLYDLPLAALQERLTQEPALATANDRGRNLICHAAVNGDAPRLRLLLAFGASVETQDTGGHTPLYRVANGSGDEDALCAAVQVLIKHGADVNQATGVGGMTPLHMAARRGTVKVADILLRAGAAIEARDNKGETPLRRAVNCGQNEMVAFLLKNGANPNTTAKDGRRPIDAARSERVRELLR